jgi:hypothetical protein
MLDFTNYHRTFAPWKNTLKQFRTDIPVTGITLSEKSSTQAGTITFIGYWELL